MKQHNIRDINDRVVRGILFSKNNDGTATDLIYATDYNYSIKNLDYDNNSFYYIDEYIRLDELLRYLGYNNDLTQSDLNRIYKKFVLQSRWLRNNRETFGLLKMSGGCYGEGGLEMVSIDIYEVLNLIEYSLKNRNALFKPQQKLIKRR